MEAGVNRDTQEPRDKGKWLLTVAINLLIAPNRLVQPLIVAANEEKGQTREKPPYSDR